MRNFYRKNHGIYYTSKDKHGNEQEHYFCEDMFISQCMIDIITNEMSVIVDLYNGIGYNQIEFSRGEIDRDIVKKLKKYGLSLPDTAQNAYYVQDILHDSEKISRCLYVHSSLGYTFLDDQLVFLASTPIGADNQAKSISDYLGKATVKPKGTLKSWKSVIRNEVIGHPTLELALTIGASSPIVHILRKERMLFSENPIWGIVGESSTGKTTVLRLMASIFGSPEEGCGIIGDCNSTENAFYKRLSNSIGMPLIVDEATGKTNWNFADIIYNLSKGQDKDRCSPDGELKQRTEFSGTVVISGEKSILDECISNSGTYARMEELSLNWTDSAEHAEHLTAGLKQNYGTAVYSLLEWILKVYRKYPYVFDTAFFREKKKLNQKLPIEKNIDHRIYNIFAGVLVTARILNKALGLKLNIQTMRELLLEQHQKKGADRDEAQRLFDAVTEYAVRNGSKFPRASKDKMQLSSLDIWGEYTAGNGGKSYLWIPQYTMKKIAEENSLTNYKKYFPILYERGQMLRPEKDRFLGKHKLRGNQVKCYQFVLNEISSNITKNLNDTKHILLPED